MTYLFIQKGSMSQDEVLEALGYSKFSTGSYGVRVQEYVSPEKSWYPTPTAIRMDPHLTPVFSPDGERLYHHKEYCINDGYRSECCYVEYSTKDGQPYYYVGSSTKEIEEYMALDQKNLKTRISGCSEIESVENSADQTRTGRIVFHSNCNSNSIKR